MNGQIGLFDYMPTLQKEPEVGEWVDTTGANIPHIMRRGYIGSKIVIDMSTESHKWYKVGILEDITTTQYYHWTGKEYEIRECDRAIVYTGTKQRSLISLIPGEAEIYECLPWDAYPERTKHWTKRR